MNPLDSLLTILFTPWGPVLVLAAGVALLFPVNVRRLPRVVQATTIFVTGLAWLWIVLLRLSPAPIRHVGATQPVLDVSMYAVLEVNQTTWPFAALVATVGLGGALLLPRRPPVGRVSGPSAGLLLLTGALIMVIAGNLPALLLGWVLMDTAYLALLLDARPRAMERTVGLTLGGFLLLWAVLVGTTPTEVATPWEHAVFPTWALVLMGLSVWLRLGAYPLHRQHAVQVPGLPLPWLWLDAVVGGSWLLRWALLAGASAVWRHDVWWILGVFAFFGSALAAWISRAPGTRLVWIVIQRTGFLVLLPLLGVAAFPNAVVAMVAAVVLGGNALFLLRTQATTISSRVAWLLAAAVLWGLPWTLGAPVRAVIAFAWEQSMLLGLAMLLGDALVAASLLLVNGGPEPEGWLYKARVAIFLVPALILGGMMANGLTLSWATWAWTTVVPLALGLFFAWQYERIFVDVREWAWGLRILAYLEPVEALARNALQWTLLALGGFVALLEGAGWLGWLLLAGTLTLVWRYLPGG